MIKMRFYYQQPILYMHLNIIHVFIFCMYKSMSFYNITEKKLSQLDYMHVIELLFQIVSQYG